MFAIYPTVDVKAVTEHAVVFTDCSHIAEYLADHFTEHYGTHHSAYLVTASWPDPMLIENLNGCGPSVFFSVRDCESAHRASHALRPLLQQRGYAEQPHALASASVFARE